MFQNNNKEEQISMTLCGISSFVVTDGNVITMESKHFNVRFYSDNCRLLSQPSFIDLDNVFCPAYLNHWSFTFKTHEVVRPQITGQPSVQFLPTKLDIVADVVVVSAAMASPAIVTKWYFY
jgi:hypothetical protein